MSTPQEQVVNAVKARGYWEGFSPIQMLARNIVKMAEELGEAAVELNVDDAGVSSSTIIDVLDEMDNVGLAAGEAFDQRLVWKANAIDVLNTGGRFGMATELADLQVVLFNAAQAFAEWRGEPFDVVQAAVDKATSDVSRGVRGAQS